MSTSCSLLRTAFPTHPLRWSGAELAGAPVRSCLGAERCWGGDARARFSRPLRPVPLYSFATGRSRRSPRRVPGSWGWSSPLRHPAPALLLLPQELSWAQPDGSGCAWGARGQLENQPGPLLGGGRGRVEVFLLQSNRVDSSASSWAASSLQCGPGLMQHMWRRAQVPRGGELGFPGHV